MDMVAGLAAITLVKYWHSLHKFYTYEFIIFCQFKSFLRKFAEISNTKPGRYLTVLLH